MLPVPYPLDAAAIRRPAKPNAPSTLVEGA